MKDIYIIRHGQTDFNLKQIVQGRGINSSINSIGIKQAKKFFKAHQEIKFDVVYTSSLKRTWQTVDNFIKLDIPHYIRTEIDEIDWGIFEGIEHNPSLQERYYNIINEWKEGNLSVKIEGGESAQDLSDRLIPFIEEIKQCNYNTILVCTHGRTLRVLMCLLNNRPISEMDTFAHSNTCLYHVKFDGTEFEIIKENDIKHLEI